MKEGWKEGLLEDIATVVHGRNQKLVESVNGQYPIYGSGGSIMGYATDYLCDEGTTILGRKGTINNPLFIKTKFWNVDTAFGIVANDNCDKKFLYYFIKSQDWSKKNTGTTLPSLTQSIVLKTPVLYPPLPEQQRIVEYLDSTFAEIDALKAKAAEEVANAKAMFDAALREEMTPKEGWEEKRIDEICSIARGGSPRPIKNYISDNNDGLNWIKIGDCDKGGKYIFSTKEKIKPEGLRKSRWVEIDDFLLSNSMSFGRPYILKTSGCIHDGWLVLRDYQKYLNIDFFYYLLSSECVQRQFKTKAQGSTVSNLNTDRVASVIIFIPSIEEQQLIVARLDTLRALVTSLEQKYTKIAAECDALKQAILRETFE